jgi:hypothetical protein
VVGVNSGDVPRKVTEALFIQGLDSTGSCFILYETIILPAILYRYEAWSHTLREEHRLRVYENRVLRTVSGPKREKVTGSWRRLQNEELHNLYASPNVIRVIIPSRMRPAGHVARMGEVRNAYNILVRKPEGKIPLGRRRCRWEDNIKMYLREIGWERVD